MSGYVFAVVFALATVLIIFSLLRSRHMREKYATAWMVVALAVTVVAIFPGILDWLADLFGIQTPINLVFFVASITLLLISVQYSVELSRFEERTRKLAEEVAILRAELEEFRAAHRRRGEHPATGAPGEWASPPGTDDGH